MATDFLHASLTALENNEAFFRRHIGPDAAETTTMLNTLGVKSLTELVENAVPENIRLKTAMNLPGAMTEEHALEKLRGLAAQNQCYKTYIGMGYSDTIVPAVIQRNVLENPAWYTAYTP